MSVARGGNLTDNHDNLLGKTMLSTWDVAAIVIYLILVIATGIYVSIFILHLYLIPLFWWKTYNSINNVFC